MGKLNYIAICLLLAGLWPMISYAEDYRIISTCGTGDKVVAIENGRTVNSARAVLATKDSNSTAQIFRIESANGASKITALHSGRTLDIRARSMRNNAAVVQYDYHGGTNQLFRLQSTSKGYQFQNVNSGLYLNLRGAWASDGQPIVQYQKVSNCSQFFKLENVSQTAPSPEPAPAPEPTPTPGPTTPSPASRDAYTLIQAESMDGKNGGSTDTSVTGRAGLVGALDNGVYLKYSKINFGSGALSITVNLAVGDGYQGQTIEIRQDEVNGPLLGSLIPQSTGGWRIVNAQSANIKKVSDVHDLYLVMKGKMAIANLDSFVFAKTAVTETKPAPAPQPGPEPVPPNPAPTPTAGALITIDQVVADQTSSSHEATVIDPRFDWQKKPQIIMQSPAGADIPSWFEGSRPQWCNSFNSWMQAFEAQGNQATNSRVQYKNLRVYILSEKTRKWTQVDLQAAPYTDTWKYPYAYAGEGGSRKESSGGVSVKPKYPNFQHGYGKGVKINGPDVRAVFAAMEFRLILDNPNGTDDRAKAKYLVNPGADYWGGSDWSYAPGVGMGKMLLAKPEWRTGTMLVPNGRYGATYNEMKTNPPPLGAP